MTTCRDVVTRALRMARITRETPAAEEATDGLTVLQSLYDGWLAGGMFGRLADVYETGSYEAKEGERVYLDAGTLTLPVDVDDERKPRDLAAIEGFTAGGSRVAYIWDRTAWVQTNALTLDSEAPLSGRGVNGLAACLAVAYAEEFGAEIPGSTVMQSRNFKQALSYKFGTEREPSFATYY